MLSDKASLGTHLTVVLRCLFSLLLTIGIASAFPQALTTRSPLHAPVHLSPYVEKANSWP